MIKKMTLLATLVIIVSSGLNVILSIGMSESDRYELVKVAQFDVTEKYEPQIEAKNLLILSDSIENVEKQIIIYQPKIWVDFNNGTDEITMNENGDLEIVSQVDVKPVINTLSMNFSFERYFKKLEKPLHWAEGKYELAYSMYRESRYSSIMPYIIIY